LLISVAESSRLWCIYLAIVDVCSPVNSEIDYNIVTHLYSDAVYSRRWKLHLMH